MSFVARLQKACNDDSSLPRGHGRQAELARRCDVSQETVRKWLNGAMQPRRSTMPKLASALGVEETWLALGNPLAIDRKQTRAKIADTEKATSAAVLLVRGFLTLAGAACAEPEESEPLDGVVDLHATFLARNSLPARKFNIHVIFVQEVGDWEFEVAVPDAVVSASGLKIVAVVRTGPNQIVMLDMHPNAVAEHGTRKAAQRHVTMKLRPQGEYTTEGLVWPQITDFGEWRKKGSGS